MRTIEVVLQEAAEGLKTEGARTLPDRRWAPRRKWSERRPGVAVAVLAAALTLVVLGVPALLTDTEADPQTAAAEQAQFSIPDESGDFLDTRVLPEEARVLVETEVPGFGVLTLSTAKGNVEGLGEATCLYISAPDAIFGSGVRPESSAICGESISTEALGIYPSEICRPEEGDHVGIIAFVGLPEGDPEVTLTLGDGTRETVPSNNGAAVWAWDNTSGLSNVQIPRINSEMIASAVDLPMGSCN